MATALEDLTEHNRAVGNLTTILVTHRLAGLDEIDEIDEIDHCVVLDRGTHAELTGRGRLFGG